MYDKLQKVWVEETGLKVGDKVKVLRRFEDCELGSIPNWDPQMPVTIGEVGEVFGINTDSIRVKFSSNHWVYPFTVLEKVEVEVEEKTKTDVPDTDRDVLFLNTNDQWEIGFYCSG